MYAAYDMLFNTYAYLFTPLYEATDDHAALLFHTAKIAVMFTELDFAVEEGISEVRVGVQKIGSNVGDITYTLTPLSLQQASSRYSYEVEGDSAEPGE